MLKVLLIAAVAALPTGAAFADEVIIHRDTTVVEPPPSTSTTVETHASPDGCESQTVHKEDDAGNSKTVTKSNCD